MNLRRHDQTETGHVPSDRPRSSRRNEALIKTRRDQSLVTSAATITRTIGESAFTLLEVMIAMGIFFMAVFTILALVSSSLRNARALQETEVDPSMLAAQLSLTNRLVEGEQSGDFGDFYRDY